MSSNLRALVSKVAPPSARTRSESEILARRHLETHNLVFVRAPILGGKTTALKNILKHLRLDGLETVFLSIGMEVSLEDFLRELSRMLGISKDGCSTVSEKLTRLNEAMIDRRLVIAIDNIDWVEGYRQFLNSHIQSSGEAKLLVSMDRDESLDESLILEVAIVELPDITLQEIQALCERLSIQIETGNETQVLNRILEYSGGQILVNRKILSWHLDRGLPISLSSLPESIGSLSSYLVERIWTSLSNKRRGALLWICAIQYHESLIDKCLEDLGRSCRAILQSCGVLNLKDGHLKVSEPMLEFVVNHQSNSLCAVREVLRYELNGADSISAIKEYIWQSLHIGDKPEAIETLNQLVQNQASNVESCDLLKLTDTIYRDISLKAFSLRRTALIARDELLQSHQESERRLERSDLDAAERAYLHAACARTTSFMGKFDEAKILIEKAMGMEIEDDPKHLFVLASAGRVFQLLDPLRALAYLDQAESLSVKWGKEARPYLGNIYFSKGYALAQLGKNQDAIKYYVMAGESFHSEGNFQMGSLAEFNSLQNLYRWGDVQSCLQRIDRVSDRLKNLGVSGIGRNLADLKIRLLMDSGKLSEAKRLWLQTFDLASLGSKDFEPTLKLVEILIQLGELAAARSFLTSLFGAEFVMSNATYRKTFHKLASLIDSAIQMEEPDQSCRELTENLDQDDHPLRSQILFVTFNLLWSGSWALLEDFSFEDLDKLSLARVEQRSMACLLAWQKLLTSKIDEASEHLRRLESFFMENQLLVWHLRTQIGLALVDLIHQQPSQAKQRLQALDPSSDGIESPMDLYLLELLKNISELKVDNLESIDNMIWINVDNFKREDNSLRKSYGLSASQQRFSDHILDLTNIGSPRQIIIRTRSEEAIIEERSFDRESLSHFDVIFDEREQVLFVKGQKISLDGRSVLSNLVRIFLQNYDSDLSKEGLALIAWKESYHPLYHDNRIYTSIKRLRQLINPKLGVDFIEARDSAYAIRRDLSFAWIANYETRARLSDQQIFLLNHLQTNGSASRQEIQKLFRSSRTQTLRELKILLDRGSIRPYGSGRSVRYRLASESLSHLDGHVAKYLRRLTRKRFHIRLHLSR